VGRNAIPSAERPWRFALEERENPVILFSKKEKKKRKKRSGPFCVEGMQGPGKRGTAVRQKKKEERVFAWHGGPGRKAKKKEWLPVSKPRGQGFCQGGGGNPAA